MRAAKAHRAPIHPESCYSQRQGHGPGGMDNLPALSSHSAHGQNLAV